MDSKLLHQVFRLFPFCHTSSPTFLSFASIQRSSVYWFLDIAHLNLFYQSFYQLSYVTSSGYFLFFICFHASFFLLVLFYFSFQLIFFLLLYCNHFLISYLSFCFYFFYSFIFISLFLLFLFFSFFLCFKTNIIIFPKIKFSSLSFGFGFGYPSLHLNTPPPLATSALVTFSLINLSFLGILQPSSGDLWASFLLFIK